MRIVIDLQCSSREWPTALMLAGAVARHRGDHEVLILLNATERERVTQLRAAFHDILPPDALRIWSAPDDLMFWKPSGKTTARKATEHIRLAALAALEPDVLLLTGLSDGYREDCASCLPFAAELPTAILLQSFPSAPQTSSQAAHDGMSSFAYLRKPVEAFCVALGNLVASGNFTELDPSHLTELSLPAESLQNEAASEWETAARSIISRLEKITGTPEEATFTDAPQRLRLAFVSPLPPVKSGIAEYSAQLLPELANYYEIEVIVDQDQVKDPRLDGIFPVRSVAWFVEHASEFDRVLYHFGNAPLHEYMHGLLRRVPGVVVLHDFYLLDWKIGGRAAENCDIILQNHGMRALIEAAQLGHDALGGWSVPANLETLQNATGVIVHGEEPHRLATEWYGPGTAKDWHVVPLLRPAVAFTQADRAEARRRLGFGPNDLVICSFGHITRTKLIGQILSAFKKYRLSVRPEAQLIFVGELETSYAAKFKAINDEPEGEISQVTGWVDTQGYLDHLLAADIAVQLRSMSRGETSASVLDGLTHGIATIVNAHGSMRELDPKTVMRISDPVSEAELGQALEHLTTDADLRAKISAKAKQEIGRLHAPRHCAELYRQAIENSALPMRRAVEQLPEHLAALSLNETDRLPLACAMAQNFPPHPRQKSLFVDVSAVVLNDINTGIQRVSRAILKALLLQPDTSYQIVPVRMMSDGTFSTVFSYAEKILDLPLEGISEYTIDVCRGDVFLVLDLNFGQNKLRRQVFERYQDAGATVWHVVYDLLPVRTPQYFPSGTFNSFDDWLTMLTAFDGAVCISHATAEDLQDWIKENVAQSAKPFEVSWFHLGADIEGSVPTRGLPDNANDVLTLLGERLTFVMVGTVEPRKGHAQTLKAFEILWAEGVDINLAIVGKKGWKVAAFTKRLRDHPEMDKHLFWFESISDEYLEKLYAASTCLIAASEGEGFGLPLIEAAQHRLPILARSIRVFREVAGVNAAYFEGLEPEDLAQSVRAWLSAWRKGDVVSSGPIPWLTWSQSALRLRRAIGLGGQKTLGSQR